MRDVRILTCVAISSLSACLFVRVSNRLAYSRKRVQVDNN